MTKVTNKPWWKISCSTRATLSVWDNLIKHTPPGETCSRPLWDQRSIKKAEWATCLLTITMEIYQIEIRAEGSQATGLWGTYLSPEPIRGKHLKKLTYYNHMTSDHSQREETQIRKTIGHRDPLWKVAKTISNNSKYQTLNQTINFQWLMANTFKKTYSNNRTMKKCVPHLKSRINWM